MNKMVFIQTPELDELDAIERRTAKADYTARALRIVDRVLPKLPQPQGWDDPRGFVAGSRRLGERKRLFYRIFARLRAKAEGGAPYLAVPPGCEHLWGPGTAMFDVARELEREARWNKQARDIGLLPLTEDERRFVDGRKA